MKFEIKPKEKDSNCFEIKLEKQNFKDLKKEIKINKAINISLSFETLNLGTKLYGSNKAETKQIQKNNCKLMIKIYKYFIRVVHLLKRAKTNFEGTIFVNDLDKKKNNNDYMLAAMLDTKFNVNPFNRMKSAMLHACEFIDLENKINNMCDFKDNKCIKHREKGIDKSTGCCISTCKYVKQGACPVKCLSCKLFMCKYLTDLGYCFSPHFIPILRVNMSIFERWASLGYLFRSEKETLRFLWTIRFLVTIYVVVIVSILIMLLVNVI